MLAWRGVGAVVGKRVDVELKALVLGGLKGVGGRIRVAEEGIEEQGSFMFFYINDEPDQKGFQTS